jgi:argininosuccinate lyase
MPSPTIPASTPARHSSRTPGEQAGSSRLPQALNLYEFDYRSAAADRIDAVFGADPFVWIETAWAVMLIRRGIVPGETLPRLLQVIKAFWDDPEPGFGGFGCLEKYVIKNAGLEVGGSLTIGRTIPPLRQLMPVRRQLLHLQGMLHDLAEAMLDAAEQHADAVMPGYTHVRHAQPTTFGHYLMSGYDPMQRVLAELERSYALLSLNELGCGALAGTSLPIDRDMTSDYLGLEGLIENSNDAVAFTDGYVHLVSNLANLMSIWSRLTLDIQYWTGEEYGFLQVPWLSAKHASQKEGGKGKSHSHFMPNKVDNSPYIERTRVGAAELQGCLSEIVAMSCRAPHADTHEMLHMIDASARAMRTTHLYLHVWMFALPRITLDRPRMLQRARAGYACASELANRIAMEQSLDYRTAHEIVNEFVAEARSRGIAANEVPLSLLEEKAKQVIGRELGVDERWLRDRLDPEVFVEVTDSRGGTSPTEVRRMIGDRRARLAEARGRHEARIEKLESAKATLLADLEGLLAKHASEGVETAAGGTPGRSKS